MKLNKIVQGEIAYYKNLKTNIKIPSKETIAN